MRILLMPATEAEIAPLTEYIGRHWTASGNSSFSHGGHILDILQAGVGMMATSYALTKALLKSKYDLAIQAGIGGSFDTGLQPGDVVLVSSEQYGDMGSEDHDNFIDVFELGLADRDKFPFTNGKLVMPASKWTERITLQQVTGLTINQVAGNMPTIEERMNKYNCQVESMEGAAFHYVCLQESVPFIQIRAISNYVEPRDKSKWKMKEAVMNLNDWLINFLMAL